MILESLVTFLPALLAGAGLVHLVWKSRDSSWSLGLKLFLGVGVGLGVTSCLYFFRLVFLPGQGGYLFIELGFLVIVLFALILRKRISLGSSFRFPMISWAHVVYALILFSVLYSALGYSLALIRNSPHGDYDAQAIWNLRARSIYRLGEMWENAFSLEINRNFHMDYPLLVPMNVLGGWNTLGEEILRVPATQSMLFLYGAAGVLFCLIAYLRRISQASLALMILITTPLLLLVTSFQTADIAVTYYFVSVTALLILFFTENKPQLLFLAGMMASLSAWTKNEGISFLLLTAIFTAWMLWKQNRLARIRFFLIGALLPVVTIVLFKIHLPASQGNDLFAGNNLAVILSRVIDPSRYVSIFMRLVTEIINLGEWRLSIVIVLTVYGLVMGTKKSIEHQEIIRWIVLLPLFQLAVYFGIYLVTPHDLFWHMKYSMSRLLLHIYPMMLLWFFLFVNTPEDALGLNPKNTIKA